LEVKPQLKHAIASSMLPSGEYKKGVG